MCNSLLSSLTWGIQKFIVTVEYEEEELPEECIICSHLMSKRKENKKTKKNRKILEYNVFIMHVLLLIVQLFFPLSPDDLNGGEMT